MPNPVQIFPPQKPARFDPFKYTVPDAAATDESQSFSKVLRKQSEPKPAEKTEKTEKMEKSSPKKPAARTEKRKADKPSGAKRTKRLHDVDETDTDADDETATAPTDADGAIHPEGDPTAEESAEATDVADTVAKDAKKLPEESDDAASPELALAAAAHQGKAKPTEAKKTSEDPDAAKTDDTNILADVAKHSSQANAQSTVAARGASASAAAEKADKPTLTPAASGLKSNEELAINPVDHDSEEGDHESADTSRQSHKNAPIDLSEIDFIKSLMPQFLADDAPAAPAAAKSAVADDLTAPAVDAMLAKAPGQSAQTAAAPAPAQTFAPELQFAEANHPKLVSDIRAQLLPHGGSMQIRLDPPELGAMQVTVEMKNGVMTASFQTTNDDATKLLSHSLGQLKAALESQGVSVEKLHVQQAPKDHESNNPDGQQQRNAEADGQSARQEQQRREMLRRMWRRIANGKDPLDLMA